MNLNDAQRRERMYHIAIGALHCIANEPNELSHEKVMLQRDYFKVTAQRALAEIYEVQYDE